MLVLRAFVDEDVTGPPIRSSTCASSRSSWRSPTSRRSRSASTRPSASRSSTSRSATSSRRSRPPTPRSATGRRCTAAGLKPDVRECSRPHFLLTNRRCSPSSTSARTSSTRSPRSRRGSRPSSTRRRQRRGHRHVRAAGGRGGDDRRSRRAGRDARGLRARRGRAVPHGALGVPPARPAHVPDHGRQGEPGVDLHEGAKAPECAGRIHTDFQRGFIRAEVIQLGRAARARLLGQGQGSRQAPRRGQGLRSPTAT